VSHGPSLACSSGRAEPIELIVDRSRRPRRRTPLGLGSGIAVDTCVLPTPGGPSSSTAPSLIAASNLALAEQGQGVADCQLPAAGLIDQAVELVAQGGLLQPVQRGDQMIMVGHQKPPPIAASYSARGRSNIGGDYAMPTSLTVAMRTALPWVPAIPARWLSLVTRP
jgi:hypothetical protein